MDMMDRRETIRFIESCRLCLRKPGIFNVFKIKGLLLDIYEFTGVKVFLAEDLPQMVCRDCSSILQNMKELREIAKTNDVHMRSLVNDKLEESKQEVEPASAQEKPDSLDTNISEETSEKFSVKTEMTIEEPLCANDSPCTSQVTVRSDLFSTESEPSLNSDPPTSSKWYHGAKIKREPSIDIETMYDFEESYKKTPREEILSAKRKASRRRYDLIKSDPELSRLRKKKDNEYYLKKKKNKQVLNIKQISEIEQQKLREKWRENSKAYYLRKKKQKEVQHVIVDKSVDNDIPLFDVVADKMDPLEPSFSNKLIKTESYNTL